MKRKTFIRNVVQKSGFYRGHLTKSDELGAARAKFERLCAKIKILKEATGTYHRSQFNLVQSRQKSLDRLKIITGSSPLGQIIAESNENIVGETSYSNIYSEVAEVSLHYLDKFFDHILKYVFDWEKVVKERVAVGLDNLEEKRIEYDYHRFKDEAFEDAIKKGKIISKSASEKGFRNKDKLRALEVDYQVNLKDIVLYINEVTDNAWKDMCPMVLKIAQFENHYNASAAQNFVKLKENVLPKLRSVGVQHRILATGRLDQISKAESKQIYTGQKLAGPTANSIVIPKDTANEIEKIVPRLLEENDDTDLVTVNTTQANIKACTNEVHNWISTYSVEPPELLKKPFSSSCAPTSYTPNAKKADMDIISLALSKDTDQHGEDLINRNCKEYGRKKAYGRKYLHKSLLPNCSNDYLKNLMNGCKQPTLDEEEKIKSDFAVRRMINSIKDGSYSENEIIKVFRKKEEQAATQKTRQMSGRRNTTMRQQKEYENFVESKLIFSKGKRQNTLSAVE